MVKLLLRHGANVTQTRKVIHCLDVDVLVNILSCGHMVLQWLAHYPCGRTPLMDASSVEVARLLLEAGADGEATDCYGGTAVHSAAQSGELEVI